MTDWLAEWVSGECLLAVTPDRSNEIVQGQILSSIDSVASPAYAFIFYTSRDDIALYEISYAA